jgi:hypothetical protein
MEIFIHLANGTFLVSFLVRDILKLRVLSVVGGFFLLAYFLLTTPVVWPSVGWNLVFAAINGVQITRLILERRPVRLSEAEHELRSLALRALSPRELKQLAPTLSFAEVAEGATFVEQGVLPTHLTVILEGVASVRRAGSEIACLSVGRFVGEMSFLTDAAPKADVVAKTPLRVARFESAALKALLADRAELRAAMQSLLGADLSEKLRGA